jgi:hypothetical protein
MDAADVPRAWDALQQAKRLPANATEKEKAYINALETRYSQQAVANRRSLDLAYATAMREVMTSRSLTKPYIAAAKMSSVTTAFTVAASNEKSNMMNFST